MSDPAQDIVDLLIGHFQQDQRFPQMSFLAWTVKMRPLMDEISNIIETAKHETRNDLLREIIND
jgi:hypothetical protein